MQITTTLEWFRFSLYFKESIYFNSEDGGVPEEEVTVVVGGEEVNSAVVAMLVVTAEEEGNDVPLVELLLSVLFTELIVIVMDCLSSLVGFEGLVVVEVDPSLPPPNTW